jgi:hypothetical protein
MLTAWNAAATAAIAALSGTVTLGSISVTFDVFTPDYSYLDSPPIYSAPVVNLTSPDVVPRMDFIPGTAVVVGTAPTLIDPVLPSLTVPAPVQAPALSAITAVTAPSLPTFSTVDLTFTPPEFSASLASVAGSFVALYTSDETALMSRIAADYDLELQRRQTTVLNQTAGRGWNFLPGAADTFLEEFTVDANRQAGQLLAETVATKDKIAYESAKQQVEFAIALMQVSIASNETKLKAAMGQIEMDKAITSASIEYFKAQVMYSGYEVAVAQMETENFKLAIQQVMQAVSIELAKVEIYKGQVSAELGVVQMYAAQADAIKSFNSVELGNMQMQNEVNRNLLTAYSANLEAYKANLAKEMVEFDAYSKAYPAEVQAWSTVAGAHAETMRVEVANIDAKNRLALAEKELILKKAEFEQDLVTKKQGLQVEITRFGLATSQQLIASALNSLNVSAQFSFSSQYGESASINESESFNYEMAAPTA